MLPDRVSNPGPLTYESGAGKDKAAKGEGWAPPFISCAQDTVGL